MSLDAFLREEVKEWNDESAMREFFAPLPLSRELDPHRWDSLMNFWSERVLPSAMRHTNSLSFTIDQLKSSLKCDGYFPAGLDSIVVRTNPAPQNDWATTFASSLKESSIKHQFIHYCLYVQAEMNRKGMVVAEGQVAAQTAGWGSWLWGNLVARPISWGWSQVVAPAEAEPATVDPKARLVLLPLLKVCPHPLFALSLSHTYDRTRQAKADEVLSKHADGVFAADHLVTQRQLLDTTGLNAQDLQILLTYMHANGKAALFETARGEKVVIWPRPCSLRVHV